MSAVVEDIQKPEQAKPLVARIDWVKASPWLYTIALFAIWEASVRIFDLPYTVLPAPSRIFAAFYQYWSPIWKNSLQTLYTTTLGFLMAVVGGLALGLFIGWSKVIYAGLYPLMIGFNAVPKVAVVPILVIWFGIGAVPAMLTAFLISFFPIVVNVAHRPRHHRAGNRGRAQGARRQEARHHAEGRHPSLDALFLWLSEGGDHAGLRRLRGVGDGGLELRPRQSDEFGPRASSTFPWSSPACWRSPSRVSSCTRSWPGWRSG